MYAIRSLQLKQLKAPIRQSEANASASVPGFSVATMSLRRKPLGKIQVGRERMHRLAGCSAHHETKWDDGEKEREGERDERRELVNERGSERASGGHCTAHSFKSSPRLIPWRKKSPSPPLPSLSLSLSLLYRATIVFRAFPFLVHQSRWTR